MIPYFPPEGGKYRLSLGLKVLAEKDWIEIDDRYATELAEKTRLIQTNRDDIYQALPGSEPHQAELLQFMTTHLSKHHPDRFTPTGHGLRNNLTGKTVRMDEAAPLLTLARLVQEDMTILRPSPEGFRLVAGFVAFPTRWNLSDKIGKVLRDIHEPVPGYDDKLARPMDRLFEGLTDDRLLARANYSLMDDPTLFQPGGHFKSGAGAALTAETIGQEMWFRVERQTLRRLPGSESIVFTVRIHQARLEEVVTTPERAADLRAATEAMPEPMQRYKSLPGFHAALNQWLENQGA